MNGALANYIYWYIEFLVMPEWQIIDVIMCIEQIKYEFLSSLKMWDKIAETKALKYAENIHTFTFSSLQV